MFNVAIIGAEGIEDNEFCRIKCINCLKKKAESGERITLLTTGDSFVEMFSKRYRIERKTFYTDWKTYGKDALKKRNYDLISECDALIMFDDGKKDTKIIYDQAVNSGIPVRNIKK